MNDISKFESRENVVKWVGFCVGRRIVEGDEPDKTQSSDTLRNFVFNSKITRVTQLGLGFVALMLVGGCKRCFSPSDQT